MESYLELAKADITRLQVKLAEVKEENNLLRVQLGQKSSDFYSRIIRFVESLHRQEYISDVELVTPLKIFPGHKFVLEARGGDWKLSTNGNSRQIKIDGAEQTVCEALIQWLYTGKLSNVNDARFFGQLMLLSKKFSLSELVYQCETNLVPLVDRANCIELYSVAYSSKANRLLEHCFCFLTAVWTSVSKEELSILSGPILLSVLEKQTRFPLHSAVKLQRADVASCLLDSNPIEVRVLVNELDADGLSPLYLALEAGLYDLAEQLLRSGADVNLPIGSLSGCKHPTALLALIKHQFKAVHFLVEHGMQLTSRSEPDGSTLLHFLGKIGPNSVNEKDHLELARLLLKRLADINSRDAQGNTPLHVCILHNSKSVFDLLLEHANRLDWTDLTQSTVSPLWLAIVADFAQDRKELLQAMGFNTDAFTDSTAVTAYTTALIRAGAPVNTRFVAPLPGPIRKYIRPGETLLMACARLGLESAALFLLEQTVSRVDTLFSLDSGEAVFHLAVESRLKRLCRRLVLEHDVDPNQFRVIPIECEPPVPASPIVQQAVVVDTSLSVPAVSKPLDPFALFPDDDDDEPEQKEQEEDLPGTVETYQNGAFPIQLTKRPDPDGQGQSVVLNGLAVSPEKPRDCRMERCTPLHLAMTHGLVEVIELYLEQKTHHEPDWFLLDHNGESVFSLALWSEQFDLANRVLIAASKFSYDRTTYRVDTAQQPPGDQAEVLARFAGHTNSPSLLHRAVVRDQLETVRFLIRHGVDVNESLANHNPGSVTNNDSAEFAPNRYICPLLTALMEKKFAIADLLVSNGADLNRWKEFAGTSIKVTLLHRAIYERDDAAADYLIRNQCDVNAIPTCPPGSLTEDSSDSRLAYLQPKLAWTPIHMTAASGLCRIVQSLVNSNRTDVSRQDSDGNTALHIAVRNEHCDVVDVLLRSSVFDCTVKNAQGHTAFYVAMDRRNVKAAQAILERDPTLALQTDNVGRNFLHLAVQNMDRAAIFFLIQTGMDMNQRVADPSQCTPLHLAIIAGVPEDIFRSLLLAGASIDDRTPQKYTPLHLCVIHNRPELLHCLLEMGASVNEQDSEKNTPLHLAIRTGHVACLTVLLAHETTDSCIMNMRGQLPIHLLAEHNPTLSVEMLQYLFEVCVAPQINAKDASGNTPLLLAYRAHNVALCIALVHAGASLGLTNSDGHSVFSLSRQRTRSAAPDRALSQILDSLMQEPKWEDGLACVECNTKFGLTNRKHHCRHCGRLLCATCSNFELPIIKFGISKPVRVCETCYNFLNNPLGI